MNNLQTSGKLTNFEITLNLHNRESGRKRSKHLQEYKGGAWPPQGRGEVIIKIGFLNFITPECLRNRTKYLVWFRAF